MEDYPIYPDYAEHDGEILTEFKTLIRYEVNGTYYLYLHRSWSFNPERPYEETLAGFHRVAYAALITLQNKTEPPELNHKNFKDDNQESEVNRLKTVKFYK